MLVFLNFVYEEINEGDWVAVDYGFGTLYIGKVSNMKTEGEKASFLYKMDRNRYRERENKEILLDIFDRSQVLITTLNIDFGIIILENQDQLQKLLLSMNKK